tara:strand:- start:30 stop:512 length:483 start_codon:yes stop_codon:yes gene_type:complete
MEVIDNFLPRYEFDKLQSFLLGEYFPWYYNDYILDDHYNDYSKFQFIHLIYRDKVTSSFSPNMQPFIDRLGVKNLFRIKSNLNLKTSNHQYGGYHLDPYRKGKIALYYINTNNGWTEFKNGNKIDSIENRMLIFDADLEHTGVTCTDQKRRVLINFNYER